MKNIKLVSTVLTATFLLTCNVYGQTPDLGAAHGFVLFTGNGAFTNTLASVVTGDIGTDNGDLTGFPPGLVTGQTYVENETSDLARIAVTAAYNSLGESSCTGAIITPITNQTLTAGTYCIGEAVNLNGNLTLDGGGDPDAVFIFKIGGAFSMAEASNILLTNGATYEHVYWQVDGAFNMAEDAFFRGTMIAHDAITLLSGASITGRALSVAGAIAISNNTVTLSPEVLPVTLMSFVVFKQEGATTLLKWTTTFETQSDRFEIEHSKDAKAWLKIGSVPAMGESEKLLTYSFLDNTSRRSANLYRLKMIDKDASFSYSAIRSLIFDNDDLTFSFYPNPATDYLMMAAENDMGQVQQIQINDIRGNRVYYMKKNTYAKFPEYLQIEFLPAGVYIMRVSTNKNIIHSFRIIKK